jgi:hypothetical protein
MNNQPAFDRSILVPIFLSGFSVIGIVVVLLIGRSLSTPPEVPMTPSATRFSYVYLGTEPAITTPLIEETEIVITDEPIFEEPTFEEPTDPSPPVVVGTPTRPGPLTPIVLPSVTPNTPAPPTVTSASLPPLSPGTYDDAHQYLVYTGWDATGALHVSFQPGSTISFRFIGRQLRLLYQGGLTLGQVRIVIDGGTPVFLDQSSGTEWASDLLSNSTHTVLITHSGGGSVNLDQVIIPDIANTPTPTPTPTRTAIQS